MFVCKKCIYFIELNMLSVYCAINSRAACSVTGFSNIISLSLTGCNLVFLSPCFSCRIVIERCIGNYWRMSYWCPGLDYVNGIFPIGISWNCTNDWPQRNAIYSNSIWGQLIGVNISDPIWMVFAVSLRRRTSIMMSYKNVEDNIRGWSLHSTTNSNSPSQRLQRNNSTIFLSNNWVANKRSFDIFENVNNYSNLSIV